MPFSLRVARRRKRPRPEVQGWEIIGSHSWGEASPFSSLDQRLRPAFASVRGNDDFGIAGSLVGTMTISKHHVFSDVSGGGVTDSGTWAKAKHEKAITLTITSSSYPADVGCVLSGTVVKDGISTTSSPGSYTCPNGPADPATDTWYYVKSGTSGVHANGIGPSRGFVG
jgi:hypothetical protein